MSSSATLLANKFITLKLFLIVCFSFFYTPLALTVLNFVNVGNVGNLLTFHFASLTFNYAAMNVFGKKFCMKWAIEIFKRW